MAVVSVLIPVRNQERYVEIAIRSILSQSYRDFVLLIMDDGSSDATPEILKRYAAQDDRVKIFLRPPRGLPTTRNSLLRLAQTPLVAWLDSDDVAMPERLGLQVEAMARDPALWLLGTGLASIDAEGNIAKQANALTGPDVTRQMLQGCKVAQTSCIMRREPVLAIGGYRPAFDWSQDYDLFLRISERGKIDNLGYVGVHYRNHGNSITNRNKLMQNLLADLARASHKLRMSSRPDPTDLLTRCPDLFNEPILDELLGEQVNIYRAIHLASNSPGDSPEALELLLRNQPNRRLQRQYQDTLLKLLTERRFDALSARALWRAATLGPGRVVRRLATLRSRVGADEQGTEAGLSSPSPRSKLPGHARH